LKGDLLIRCEWAGDEPSYVAYHDQEWGVPIYDDRQFFELLILEGAQAGLSWLTILRKRAAYREAFEDFSPEKVAAFDETRLEALLYNPGIVRNRLKLRSAVENARAFLVVQDEFGSFARYVWAFVGGRPVQNEWESLGEIPTQTPESIAFSKDLRRRGFRFVGPTIMYAFMQSAGLVNDHIRSCFRYQAVRDFGQSRSLPEG
jgi:DNA-3-methyladenine glycosylase I